MFESYDPLHLRHRPLILNDLVGQDLVRETLASMFERGKVPRTFFIYGPYGSGKTTTARMIARYLNCSGRTGDNIEPCLKCVHCTTTTYSDYVEINAADARGIDGIRELRRGSQFAPMASYRVFVLDEVHQLSGPAIQALLKITEEPPSRSVFVLCTTDPGRIPSALISRATKLPIQKVSVKACTKLLVRVYNRETGKKPPKGMCGKIAGAIEGNPRDALVLLEQVVSMSEMKPDVDLKSLVVELLEDTTAGRPEVYATAILQGIYRGRYTQALDAVRKYDGTSGTPGLLAEIILRFHTAAINGRCSKKLRDPYQMNWYAKLDDIDPFPDMEAMVDVMDIWVRALDAVKSFKVPERYVMTSSVVSSVIAVQSALPDSSETAKVRL